MEASTRSMTESNSSSSYQSSTYTKTPMTSTPSHHHGMEKRIGLGIGIPAGVLMMVLCCSGIVRHSLSHMNTF